MSELDDYTFAATGPLLVVSRGAKVLHSLHLALSMDRIAVWFDISDADPMASYGRYITEVMDADDAAWMRTVEAEDGVLALAIMRVWADAVGGRLGKLRSLATSGDSTEPPSLQTSGTAGD